MTLLRLPAVDSFAAPRHAYLRYRRPWKAQSRMAVETALTCSQNSQLALLFLVRNALELTEFLARNQCSNNNHARTFQLSELRGRRPSPLLVSVSATWQDEDTHPPLASTGRCDRRDLLTSPGSKSKISPVSVSFRIYSARWRFVIRQLQTHGQRITHFKPQRVIYKARVTDKNHLSWLF